MKTTLSGKRLESMLKVKETPKQPLKPAGSESLIPVEFHYEQLLEASILLAQCQ